MRLFLHALLVCAVNSLPQNADEAPKFAPSSDITEGAAGAVAVSQNPGVSASDIELPRIPSSENNPAGPSDPNIEPPLDTTAGSGDTLLAGTFKYGDDTDGGTNGSKDPLGSIYNQCTPKRLACCQNWNTVGFTKCIWYKRQAHWCEYPEDWVCCNDVEWSSSTGTECEPLAQPDPQPAGSEFDPGLPTWGGPGDSLQPGGFGIPFLDQFVDTVGGHP